MKLQPITREGCQQVRIWRNEFRQSLRTTILITKEQQDAFYDRLQDRNCEDRYWEIHEDDAELRALDGTKIGEIKSIGIVAMVGLTDIDWVNRLAEISLFVSPDQRQKGVGTEALRLTLEEAFDHMNLHQVLGECFYCNPCCGFWKREVRRYYGVERELPDRKWWGGKWWSSYYFSIFEQGYWKAKQSGFVLPGIPGTGGGAGGD